MEIKEILRKGECRKEIEKAEETPEQVYERSMREPNVIIPTVDPAGI